MDSLKFQQSLPNPFEQQTYSFSPYHHHAMNQAYQSWQNGHSPTGYSMGNEWGQGFQRKPMANAYQPQSFRPQASWDASGYSSHTQSTGSTAIYASLWGNRQAPASPTSPQYLRQFTESPQSMYASPSRRASAPAQMNPSAGRISIPGSVRASGTVEGSDGEIVGTISFNLRKQDIADFISQHPNVNSPEEMLSHLQGTPARDGSYPNSKIAGSYSPKGGGESNVREINYAPDLSRMPHVRDILASQMADVRNEMRAASRRASSPPVPPRPQENVAAASQMYRRHSAPAVYGQHAAATRSAVAPGNFPKAHIFSGNVEDERGDSTVGYASMTLKDQDIANFLMTHPNSTNATELLQHMVERGIDLNGTYRRVGSENESEFNHVPDLSRMIGLRSQIEGQMKAVQQMMNRQGAQSANAARPAPPPPPRTAMETRTSPISFPKAHIFSGNVEDERGDSTVGYASMTLKDQDIANFLMSHPHSTDATELLLHLVERGIDLNGSYRRVGSEEASEFNHVPDLSRMIGLRSKIENQMKEVQQAMDQAPAPRRASTSDRFNARFAWGQ